MPTQCPPSFTVNGINTELLSFIFLVLSQLHVQLSVQFSDQLTETPDTQTHISAIKMIFEVFFLNPTAKAKFSVLKKNM